jgi:hypothetical protein
MDTNCIEGANVKEAALNYLNQHPGALCQAYSCNERTFQGNYTQSQLTSGAAISRPVMTELERMIEKNAKEKAYPSY